MNTTVLKWARETAGYHQTEVVAHLKQKRVNLDTLNQWENGESYPTYTQLKKLSRLYKRPTALFYFPHPPEEAPIDQNFRYLSTETTHSIPPEIRYLVRKAKVRQMDLAELIDNRQPAAIFNIEIPPDAISLAQKMREYLAISIHEQKKWKDSNEALKKWREAIEKLGVWVFKDNFKNDDYCGFCLHDNVFPIIYLNNNQAKERQIFTLFHEVGHLIKRCGGIDFRIAPTSMQQDRNEIFCNAFAGNVLVPSKELCLSSEMPSDTQIKRMAHEYNVSVEVILRRCVDTNLISPSEYREKVTTYYRQFKPKNKTGGGRYYSNQKAYLGEKYLNLVFGKYYRQHITPVEVADYFGMPSISTAMHMESEL